jgi:hypothetical protein
MFDFGFEFWCEPDGYRVEILVSKTFFNIVKNPELLQQPYYIQVLEYPFVVRGSR